MRLDHFLFLFYPALKRSVDTKCEVENSIALGILMAITRLFDNDSDNHGKEMRRLESWSLKQS